MAAREEIVVVGGRSFMLSNALGDVEPGGRLGLFQGDTRFLSRHRLTLDGLSPLQLSADQVAADSACFYATNPELPHVPAGTLSLERRRGLNGHLTEQIDLTNYHVQPVKTVLRFELGSDFADVLELRALPPSKLGPSDIAPPAGWQHAFAYRRDHFTRRTLARWSQPGRHSGSLTEFDIALEPGETWRCSLDVVMTGEDNCPEPAPFWSVSGAGSRACAAAGGEHAPISTRDAAPEPAGVSQSQRAQLRERALADLRTLRLTLPDGETIVGAGLPYYMALFGRDSLLTAYQMLSLEPSLAASVLRALARYQGKEHDLLTDQEPGKIPHEVREGELALLGDRRYGCYYGTVDATPLYLVLFSEYLRRTGDLALREELWPAAEAALNWIDRYGDRDGDGFVEYRCNAPSGLENQGWKDSGDSIAFAAGPLAGGPIALCEVQGYVFDAKRRMADLYEDRGDSARAGALRAEAAQLQTRFEEAFWLPSEGTYAVALDGAKRPVDAVASNAAHCLWSGIAGHERAAGVAERLSREDMFSGWGLRTLSTRMARYNPLSYHNGSIWPHDTVLAAAGFLRCGQVDAARRLLFALLEAAARLPDQRLPELFAGYPRLGPERPVPYPDASAPQAWAAGATVLAIELLEQIERDAPRRGQDAADSAH